MQATKQEEEVKTMPFSNIGRRIDLRGSFGTIRYEGPLLHVTNKNQDDIWFGVEWDELGKGKHRGTVQGAVYFKPQLHSQATTLPCASLLRAGKFSYGLLIDAAIAEKYRTHQIMSKQQIKQEEKQLATELYIPATRNQKKQIEFVGINQSYKTYSAIEYHREIALQEERISDLGKPGNLSLLIPRVINLYFDKNLLYSWEQYLQIVTELPYLNTLTLTQNIFRRVQPGDVEKWVEQKGKGQIVNLINPSLTVLVLIKMNLDWEQIMLLSPLFAMVEELHLVRNHCHSIDKICKDKYPIEEKKCLTSLKFLNLEENGIQKWEEITPLSKLQNLAKLTLTRNPLSYISYNGIEVDGFKTLTTLALDYTQLSEWSSVNRLNLMPCLKSIRISKTPIHMVLTQTDARRNCIARIAKLQVINGSKLKETQRRDSQIVYVRQSYQEFIEVNKADPLTMTMDNQVLRNYMNEVFPRWFELVEVYGNPLEMIREQKDFAGTSISKTSAKVLIQDTITGKQVNKKLLVVMTVKALRAMCAKIFKVSDISVMKLLYSEGEIEYELDDEMRQLSYYGIRDDGLVRVMY